MRRFSSFLCFAAAAAKILWTSEEPGLPVCVCSVSFGISGDCFWQARAFTNPVVSPSIYIPFILDATAYASFGLASSSATVEALDRGRNANLGPHQPQSYQNDTGSALVDALQRYSHRFGSHQPKRKSYAISDKVVNRSDRAVHGYGLNKVFVAVQSL
ncbi:hypothetical protein C8J56DRAFT_943680 [Mycena floridula]|nr:hypothetical protein C8J56DRAFT_977885 [Mycena floridula]KAJ7587147.1 hypothetical protein C8J56DRAFT_943680 [Mycena floridula]